MQSPSGKREGSVPRLEKQPRFCFHARPWPQQRGLWQRHFCLEQPCPLGHHDGLQTCSCTSNTAVHIPPMLQGFDNDKHLLASQSVSFIPLRTANCGRRGAPGSLSSLLPASSLCCLLLPSPSLPRDKRETSVATGPVQERGRKQGKAKTGTWTADSRRGSRTDLRAGPAGERPPRLPSLFSQRAARGPDSSREIGGQCEF